MKNESFLKGMLLLQQFFGRTLEPEVMEIYKTALNALDDETFLNGVARVVSTFTPTAACPFPVVAIINEACGNSPDQKAQNMLTKLRDIISSVGAYESVDFGDPALHAIINRYGGWPVICRWEYEDWQLNERNFLNAYKASVAFGEYAVPVIGITTAGNNLAGHDGYIPAPIQIGQRGEILKIGFVKKKITEQSKFVS